MNTPLTIYTDYSEASHVITSPRLKEELASFRVDVLKGELKATWHPRLVKIPERKGWLVKKEKLEQLKSFLSIYNISYTISPLPPMTIFAQSRDVDTFKEIHPKDAEVINPEPLVSDAVQDLLSKLTVYAPWSGHNYLAEEDMHPPQELGHGLPPSALSDTWTKDATNEFKKTVDERSNVSSTEPLYFDIRDQPVPATVVPPGGTLIQETLPNGFTFPVVVLPQDYPVPAEYAKV